MCEYQTPRKVQIALLCVFMLSSSVRSQTFPSYSQQCSDDAGPPFVDDEESFGPGGKYHDDSPATPVLTDSGECATPIKAACDSGIPTKQAYIEGPIECNGNGWYCRILVDPNWPPMNLIGDLNFGYCNSTEFADTDQSGHCHGSDDEATYYWWMRDHWHRGYNGRLRCCCNWEEGNNALESGSIANRCDYRRLVVDENDAEDCRDANEDHGQNYKGGCTVDPTDEPIVENEDQCWELQRFGYFGDDDNDGDGSGDNSGDGDEDNSGDGDEDNSGDGSGDDEDEEDFEDCRGSLRGIFGKAFY